MIDRLKSVLDKRWTAIQARPIPIPLSEQLFVVDAMFDFHRGPDLSLFILDHFSGQPGEDQ